MSDNHFFDTNVLVYAFDRDAKGRKTAGSRRLIEQCLTDGTGVISTQVLKEFYVTMTQKIETPLDPRDAEEILEDFEGFQLVVIDQKLIYRAIEIDRKEPISFRDALICSAAGRARCDVLYSEDLNHEQTYGSVTAVNPFH